MYGFQFCMHKVPPRKEKESTWTTKPSEKNTDSRCTRLKTQKKKKKEPKQNYNYSLLENRMYKGMKWELVHEFTEQYLYEVLWEVLLPSVSPTLGLQIVGHLCAPQSDFEASEAGHSRLWVALVEGGAHRRPAQSENKEQSLWSSQVRKRKHYDKIMEKKKTAFHILQ